VTAIYENHSFNNYNNYYTYSISKVQIHVWGFNPHKMNFRGQELYADDMYMYNGK